MRRPLLLALALLTPQLAQAGWWNDQWTARQPLHVDTSATGSAITDPIGPTLVLVRLVAGNFNFAAAAADGSDLRFIAGDDQTPLKFHFERYDSLLNEALIWVGLPELKPGARSDLWLYYGNPKAVAAQDAKGTFDPGTSLNYHFDERGQPPKDSSTWANDATSAAPGTDALIGSGLQLEGRGAVGLPASPSLRWAAGAELSWSAWVRPAEEDSTGVIFSRRDGANAFAVGLEGGKPYAQLERGEGRQRAEAPATLPAASWHHLAVTVGAGLALFVDGVPVATLVAKLPALDTAAWLGGEGPPAGVQGASAALAQPGFKGELDELQLARVQRPVGFFRAAFAGQGLDAARFLTVGAPEERSTPGGGAFGIILQSVTPDGWVIIGLLGVMGFASGLVLVSKATYLSAVERANARFTERYHQFGGDLLALATVAEGSAPLGDERVLRSSSLYRVFLIASEEVRRRAEAGRALSPEALEVLRARVDSGLVRENQRLSERMVLLTIAISGGPFLGLLGTVVGVMITFASIAAAGDVNVNAIAPGIAAALVATVAGLAVAIPALFGYNWLLTRIKNVTATMQVFVDELLSGVAESFADAAQRPPRPSPQARPIGLLKD